MGRGAQLEPLPDEVAALRKRIEEWRRTRSGLGPMPAELWERASEIAARRGIYSTAKGLGVKYDPLASRVKASGGSEKATIGFVEWNGAAILGSGAPAGTVVEIADQSGRQMTVRVADGERIDVTSLVAAFCNARA